MIEVKKKDLEEFRIKVEEKKILREFQQLRKERQ